jgi:1-acyl-sn-glycerol-3-phosphate acyltransferase
MLSEPPSAAPAPAPDPAPFIDEFGMDRAYIARRGKTLFKFLCDYYWRVETKGLEHVPRQGPAILAGTHRGFMPWDGVMALHLVVGETGRVPRFLTHPGLLKFRIISNFVTRLGGVLACQENADRLLQSGELLGVYPEGVQGAFALYREAYQVRRFGHRDFVRMALRHRVPIIPFVNVGSAEALPVFAQIKWQFWIRHMNWPCLPISTFPLVPAPLPSKWHIQFLPPLHPEQQYGPEAADDDAVVRRISEGLRTQMQQAIDEILRRRRRVFWGSVFGKEQGA